MIVHEDGYFLSCNLSEIGLFLIMHWKKRDLTSAPIYTYSRWMILDTRKTLHIILFRLINFALPSKEIETDMMFHRSKNIAWDFFFHHYICITLPKAIILTPQLSIYANLYYICSCIIQFNCFVLAIFIQSALSTDSLS